MEQYLLYTPDGYYFIWFKPNGKNPQLNGPHSDKPINLPIIKVDNPYGFKP